MFLRILSLVTLSSLFTFASVYAQQHVDEYAIHIATYEEDLTGDGINETIIVEGVHLSDHSPYYHSVWAIITSEKNDVWKIHLPGGLDPTIQFVDLTNNGTLDILYQSVNDQEIGTYTSALFTIENNEFMPMPIPKETFAHGSLQDNFLAHLFITPHQSPVIIDLKTYASSYLQSGIYNEDGEVVEQHHLRISSPQTIENDYNNEHGQHTLQTTQYVYGPPYTEPLGMIVSEWIFTNGSWKLIESAWK